MKPERRARALHRARQTRHVRAFLRRCGLGIALLIGTTMWNGWSMNVWAQTERADPSIETASAEAATFSKLHGEAHLQRIIG